jgi:hypothetical protein
MCISDRIQAEQIEDIYASNRDEADGILYLNFGIFEDFMG